MFRVGVGHSSKRFLPEQSSKLCRIGGVIFEDIPGFDAGSDGDVIFQAICNAITSLTGVPILGKVAIDLCYNEGITDSQVYLEKALETLGLQKIQHIALSVEAKRPQMQEHILEIRQKVAEVTKIEMTQVGLTVISGAGLTDFGCGDGVQCFCILTTSEL